VVGDLLYIKKDECFPADIVILSSSNPNSQAFINTSSLDGEKTLKPKVTNPFKLIHQ
jgi:P-type E1-E2 ATPase